MRIHTKALFVGFMILVSISLYSQDAPSLGLGGKWIRKTMAVSKPLVEILLVAPDQRFSIIALYLEDGSYCASEWGTYEDLSGTMIMKAYSGKEWHEKYTISKDGRIMILGDSLEKPWRRIEK